MKRVASLIVFLCFHLFLHSQDHQPVFTGPFSVPLLKEVNTKDIFQPHWQTTFQYLYKEEEEGNVFNVESLKRIQTAKKLKSLHLPITADKKTRTSAPVIGTNFKGNQLISWTPTDNTLAISDSGNIVTCVNWGIEYYDTAGNCLLFNQTWDAFFNDSTLSQGKFDPRVIYDRTHDRFVLVLLHGFSSATSKVLVCFSKTQNPLDGWYVYKLSGNPYNESAWTDYPLIGLNDDDLFISGNRFGDAPSYDWKGAYIYHIGLDNGYSGSPLQFGLWNNIYAPDGEEGFSLYPVSHGFGKSISSKMYLVHLRPDSGSKVYLYEIDGKLQSPTKTLTGKFFKIPHYDVCGNAFEKDPTTNNIDSLSTGSAMVQNAFYNNKNIHFVFDADISNGWCGIHYGRIKLDSNKAVVMAYGIPGTDMAYPALAAFGRDTNDQSVAIAFLRSDSTITPECDAIGVDHKMVFSSHETVKQGDTVVNILYPPAYPIMPERWGDYTGIARKMNADTPEVWMAGAYGANTPPRPASYSTWIAQLRNNNAPTAVSHTSKVTQTATVYPNPVMDMFTVEASIEEDADLDISLYSMEGKRIRSLFHDHVAASGFRLSFNKLMLNPGIYFVAIRANNEEVKTVQLVVE